MTDLLRLGQKWLAEKLSQFASREIVYRRDDKVVILQATIGKTKANRMLAMA